MILRLRAVEGRTGLARLGVDHVVAEKVLAHARTTTQFNK